MHESDKSPVSALGRLETPYFVGLCALFQINLFIKILYSIVVPFMLIDAIYNLLILLHTSYLYGTTSSLL